MKKALLKCGVIILVLSYILVGCSPMNSTGKEIPNDPNLEVKDAIETKVKIYASFYPLYDFAKKVGGDLVDVQVVVGDGVDPHSFDPSPRLIAEMETADIFIYNGLGMEPWVEGVLENLKDKGIIIIQASKGLDIMDYHEEGEHKHNHGQQDPHIWMDPMNTIKISEGVKEALVGMDSDNAQIYEENFIKFKGDIENLDDDFKEALRDVKNRKILVSHSAFRYLARRYDLEEIAVSGVSPHEEPSPTRLAELTKEAEKHNLKYIFFESLANPKTAETLGKEAGLEVLMLYNMEGLTKEQRQEGEDYISLMYKNLENLKKALVE